MIKKEFKDNLKSFIIWTSILLILFFVVYLIYPFMFTDEMIMDIDDMMKMFPPDLLKSFNMDVISISTAYGWVKSEGFMFVLIITGIFSSMLGFNILLKEEYDKTSEYLGFVPITRNKILTNKIIVGIIYVIFMIILFGVFNFICLNILQEFDYKEFFLLSISPLLTLIPMFALNLFISTFVGRPKKSVGLSLGLVFLFYFLNVISELSEDVEIFKYFSLYTLCDIRNIITNCELNPICIIISILITIILLLGSYIKYNKKELI